ncbi:hypothetical protein BFS06_11445 [Clostridium perfringens]|uniref:Uncharacterized protein n=1 Tax=Clostridium perfringens TaxID=1502 RepID=A0A140GRZ6_CLOPF|nr:hypothetical protein [Clostridium perfringens]AMN31305.1 hypothetical protein JFP838_pA0389 [Clostridium perfringens]TBX14829.1 hypothetical protein BFS06_11445 [Clostridium perfringens]
MKFFTYGNNKLIHTQSTPIYVDSISNKIITDKKSLWGSSRNKYYSDWFVITLALPMLIEHNCSVEGFEYDLDFDNYNIISINKNNYKDYITDKLLDLKKIGTCDAIIFDKELVDTVKEFEGYYVDSVQIFNTDCIKTWETTKMDIPYITSNEFRDYVKEKSNRILEHIRGSEIMKLLFK